MKNLTLTGPGKFTAAREEKVRILTEKVETQLVELAADHNQEVPYIKVTADIEAEEHIREIVAENYTEAGWSNVEHTLDFVNDDEERTVTVFTFYF